MKFQNLILPFVLVLSFSFQSCEKLDDAIAPGLTNEEIIAGLKEALRVGTDTSVSILNRQNGYFADQAVKILLPPEASIIKENISKLKIPGGEALLDELILKINRSAEDAAAEAKPIFVDAITNITITDGLNILKGTDTAATHYLKSNTYNPLKDKFKPRIQNSLGKAIVGNISAESAYASLINRYNDAVTIANLVPGTNYQLVTENSLSEYTTKRALDGLFLKVSEEEKAIRKDPVARVTDILKKVFGTNDLAK